MGQGKLWPAITAGIVLAVTGCTIGKVPTVERVEAIEGTVKVLETSLRKIERDISSLRAEMVAATSSRVLHESKSIVDSTLDSMRFESMMQEFWSQKKAEEQWREKNPVRDDWPEEIRLAALLGKVTIGMKWEQVLAAWGEPVKVEKIESPEGLTLVATFERKRFWSIGPRTHKPRRVEFFSKSDHKSAEVKEIRGEE